jgi:hypothetical protein
MRVFFFAEEILMNFQCVFRIKKDFTSQRMDVLKSAIVAIANLVTIGKM